MPHIFRVPAVESNHHWRCAGPYARGEAHRCEKVYRDVTLLAIPQTVGLQAAIPRNRVLAVARGSGGARCAAPLRMNAATVELCE